MARSSMSRSSRFARSARASRSTFGAPEAEHDPLSALEGEGRGVAVGRAGAPLCRVGLGGVCGVPTGAAEAGAGGR